MEFSAHDKLPEFTLGGCVAKGCEGEIYAEYHGECGNAVDYNAHCDKCGLQFLITIIDKRDM